MAQGISVDRTWVVLGGYQYRKNRAKQRRVGSSADNIPYGSSAKKLGKEWHLKPQKRGFGVGGHLS